MIVGRGIVASEIPIGRKQYWVFIIAKEGFQKCLFVRRTVQHLSHKFQRFTLIVKAPQLKNQRKIKTFASKVFKNSQLSRGGKLNYNGDSETATCNWGTFKSRTDQSHGVNLSFDLFRNFPTSFWPPLALKLTHLCVM